jgi:hypothetical protein
MTDAAHARRRRPPAPRKSLIMLRFSPNFAGFSNAHRLAFRHGRA